MQDTPIRSGSGPLGRPGAMIRLETVSDAELLGSDLELETRTSWADASVAYRQIKKVVIYV